MESRATLGTWPPGMEPATSGTVCSWPSHYATRAQPDSRPQSHTLTPPTPEPPSNTPIIMVTNYVHPRLNCPFLYSFAHENDRAATPTTHSAQQSFAIPQPNRRSRHLSLSRTHNALPHFHLPPMFKVLPHSPAELTSSHFYVNRMPNVCESLKISHLNTI